MLSDILGLACGNDPTRRGQGDYLLAFQVLSETSDTRVPCLLQIFSIRDSFDVRDASGQTAFQLRGALVSMREVSFTSFQQMKSRSDL